MSEREQKPQSKINPVEAQQLFDISLRLIEAGKLAEGVGAVVTGLGLVTFNVAELVAGMAMRGMGMLGSQFGQGQAEQALNEWLKTQQSE